jgi:hypothetical protein
MRRVTQPPLFNHAEEAALSELLLSFNALSHISCVFYNKKDKYRACIITRWTAKTGVCRRVQEGAYLHFV